MWVGIWSGFCESHDTASHWHHELWRQLHGNMCLQTVLFYKKPFNFYSKRSNQIILKTGQIIGNLFMSSLCLLTVLIGIPNLTSTMFGGHSVHYYYSSYMHQPGEIGTYTCNSFHTKFILIQHLSSRYNPRRGLQVLNIQSFTVHYTIANISLASTLNAAHLAVCSMHTCSSYVVMPMR